VCYHFIKFSSLRHLDIYTHSPSFNSFWYCSHIPPSLIHKISDFKVQKFRSRSLQIIICVKTTATCSLAFFFNSLNCLSVHESFGFYLIVIVLFVSPVLTPAKGEADNGYKLKDGKTRQTLRAYSEHPNVAALQSK